MTQPATGGDTPDGKISAKELASYEWKGMGNKEGRALFEGSESIKITVGTDSNQKTWYLPKKVLTHCSPFFDAALNGSFVEASSKTVDLPEDDPMAFEIWATWLSLGNCGNGDDCEDEYPNFDLAYVRAWKLGEKLACPAFKDHVMSCLLSWSRSSILGSEIIRSVYEDSSSGSKLRRVFVDMYVWYKLEVDLDMDAQKFIDILREIPEFLEDSVKREMEVGKYNNPWEDSVQYYENPAFEPKPESSR